MCLSTDGVTDMDTRSNLGYLLLVAVISSIAINLGNAMVRLFIETLKPFFMKLAFKCNEMRQKMSK
jgi:hypothetical protein